MKDVSIIKDKQAVDFVYRAAKKVKQKFPITHSNVCFGGLLPAQLKIFHLIVKCGSLKKS